jgi:tyrosyl-tRNA synthetase
MNTDDRDVINYLKFFTWLDEITIREIETTVQQRPEQREAQRRLAQEMTRMVHDETALQKAEQASQVLFGGEVAGLTGTEVADIFADVPSGEVASGKLQGDGLPVVDMLAECRVVTSKGEARRAIEAGGVYLNNRRISDATVRVTVADVIDNQFIVLRHGRKNYWLVRIA